MSETRIIRHIVVQGHVQGVGFRAFVEDAAYRQRLIGWVRNRRDGSVEAVLAGPAAAVREAIEVCRKGPPGSRVDALYEREATADELGTANSSAFAVLPTA
ncbi:MAG: acylphosphatase [Pseudolabrys sp.]|nr:acylphosphatase [Pseudolabrys sp.]MBV9260299.1 acylphosphatase [Pseudolabrys sp.]